MLASRHNIYRTIKFTLLVDTVTPLIVAVTSSAAVFLGFHRRLLHLRSDQSQNFLRQQLQMQLRHQKSCNVASFVIFRTPFKPVKAYSAEKIMVGAK